MSVFDKVLGLIAPHECAGGCGAEGLLLCDRCAARLPQIVPCCYRCGAFSADWITCKTCRRHSKLTAVRAVTAYEGPAKQMVWKLKFEGAQAAAAEMARLMSGLLGKVTSDVVVTHVPTATSRVRLRGYDQARLLARHLARENTRIYLPCLQRVGQHQQVGATAAVRRTQLAKAFRPLEYNIPAGGTVILVDDVLTTGATLEAAAAELRRAGVKRVEAIVFARAQ